jgi:excisionase family DNA binding protein
MTNQVMLKSSEANPFLTVGEASEFLHIHTNTLRRWSDAGLLVSYRICSRGDRRFLREDLMRFLTKHSAYKDGTQ